jgi:hypothetical protein
MWVSTIDGATPTQQVEYATNRQDLMLIDFQAGSTFYAQAGVVMPSDWNGGTVTATFYWLVNGTGSGNVRWGCQGRAYAANDAIDQAWGTGQVVTQAGSGTANQLLISSATAAITFSGAPAASQYVQFRIYRDGGNAGDTLTDWARLLGVMISFTRQ